MAKSPLCNTYRQYKSGTERVVCWLVEKSGRTGKEDYPPANHLPALARNVLPEHDCSEVLQVLNQVIQARTECAAQYRSKVEDHVSNMRHEHFIDILKEVRRILLHLQPGNTPQIRQHPVDHAPTLKNRFELLELQEPVEWNARVVEANLETRRLSDAGDDVFAQFCFLMDCHRIRKQVILLWEQYSRREVSAVIPALATNVAFDNIARLHSELVAEFPRYSSYEALEEILLDDEERRATSLSPHTIADVLPGHEVYNVLTHYLKGYQRGVFIDYDLEDDNFEFSSSLPHAYGITKLLARNIPDVLCFVLAQDSETGVMDELSSILGTLYEHHKLTVPLVFAFKIFVDIHISLQGNVQRTFQGLQASAKRAQISLRKLDIHNKALEADCSSPGTKKALNVLRSFLHTLVETDIVANFRANRIIRPVPTTAAPFYMLRNHPTLCGSLRFHIDRTMCYIGLRLCNEWECCVGVLHLYNALKPQVPTWIDMETLVSMYGETYLFAGRAPSKPKEQFKRANLAGGVSFSGTLHGRRRITRTPPVLLTLRQPLLDIMRQRYSIKNGKKDSLMVLQDVETVLRFVDDRPRSALRVRALRQWKRDKHLHPADMLALVAEGVQQEESQLYFDFVSFNRRCIEITRRLRTRLAAALPELVWPQELSKNEMLAGIPLFALEILSYENSQSQLCKHAIVDVLSELISREGSKETEALSTLQTDI